MAIPLLSTLLDLIKEPLDRLIPDKNKRMELEHNIQTAALKAGLAQMEINKQEAAHRSVFVAGWRPAVGWVCALALAWHFILFDMLSWARVVFWPDSAVIPELTGTETLLTVLMSLLGLGGLRTVEKLKGVTK